MPGYTKAEPILLDDCQFTYNTVDLSDHVRAVNLVLARPSHEVSAMGNKAAVFLMGRKEFTLEVTFWQDFYTSEVHATLITDYTTPPSGGRAVKVLANKTLGKAPTNPEAQFNVFIENYPIISGEYANPLEVPVTFRPTGDITLATA